MIGFRPVGILEEAHEEHYMRYICGIVSDTLLSTEYGEPSSEVCMFGRYTATHIRVCNSHISFGGAGPSVDTYVFRVRREIQSAADASAFKACGSGRESCCLVLYSVYCTTYHLMAA